MSRPDMAMFKKNCGVVLISKSQPSSPLPDEESSPSPSPTLKALTTENKAKLGVSPLGQLIAGIEKVEGDLYVRQSGKAFSYMD